MTGRSYRALEDFKLCDDANVNGRTRAAITILTCLTLTALGRGRYIFFLIYLSELSRLGSLGLYFIAVDTTILLACT